ncbi:MAG: DUF4126 family protein [Solirubrobacteraceae bacterium]
MHLVFDIFQGIGIAAAVGIRPFLPALVVGALAAGNVEIDFAHTGFSFLQKPVFLLIMVVAVVVVSGFERRVSASPDPAAAASIATRALPLLLTAAALVIGALLFGASIDRSHHPAVIGIIAGVICAGIGILATQPLLARVRARLDEDALGALPLIVEATATLGAVLSVVAPPVGVILLAALVWLLIAGRGRGQSKYAGLRILR